ncbi:MAG: tRNA 2-thiocytidine(32) synthetase TtcA [Lachnospiraceae bacterium]|nr:tRNA 2-thiocytidine(32) synthetase TtcA [Lachnospiraceae bacterium]
MKEQRMLSLLRQAIRDYNMISDGDRVCIGLSGGKDSMTLLALMQKLSLFDDMHFTLCAVMVDLGFRSASDNASVFTHDRTSDSVSVSDIASFCENKGVLFSRVDTQIAQIVFEAKNETRPCSLCANLRKGALVNEAVRLGCSKIAYAHHRDDMIETALLSVLQEGRFYCFPPVTDFEDKGLQILRPMMYVPESAIQTFVRENQTPVLKNPCPMDGRSRRQEAKELLYDLEKRHKGAKDQVFRAILNAGFDDWPRPSGTVHTGT